MYFEGPFCSLWLEDHVVAISDGKLPFNLNCDRSTNQSDERSK